MKFKLGTRKSPLAQVQSRWVATQLQRYHPSLQIELVLITTAGDERQKLKEIPPPVPSETGGLKALFTKELEDALLDRRIDFAVHSLKDMLPVLPQGLAIGAIPIREDARDAWIGRDNVSFKQLRHGARVGTSSVRRVVQLKALRPDLEIIPMRGNVDTRLKKMDEQQLDGIVLAAAGLNRLQRQDVITDYFSVDELLPAPGQGALAIEIREQDALIREVLSVLSDPVTTACVTAERSFAAALAGDCQTPLAAYATLTKNEMSLFGCYTPSVQGALQKHHMKGASEDAGLLGRHLADVYLSRENKSFTKK